MPDRVAQYEVRSSAPVLFVCEHATNAIPHPWPDLGLDARALQSHIAWDPGALSLARYLVGRVGGALLSARQSRLLYDLNRPPTARDAIPAVSEQFEIPGNRDLSEEDRSRRIEGIYRPWCGAFDKALADCAAEAVVTVHSFTRVYNGQARDTRVGILHDEDRALADALLSNAAGMGQDWHRNRPYGPEDGVTHTLRVARGKGVRSVMIEVRSDLLASPGDVSAMGDMLARAILPALAVNGVVIPETEG